MKRVSIVAAGALLVLALTAAPAVGSTQIVQSDTPAPVPEDGQGSDQVKCPAGTQVTGGGGFTDGTSALDLLAESAPYDGGDRNHAADDGWFAAINGRFEPTTMITYAICSDSLDLVYRERPAIFSNGIDGRLGEAVGCPRGADPTSGGIAVDGAFTSLSMFLSRPTKNNPGWRTVISGNVSSQDATVHVICAAGADLAYPNASGDAAIAGRSTFTAQCPPGGRVLGGGGFISRGWGRIGSLLPADGSDADSAIGDAWSAVVANQDDHNERPASAYASCLT